MRIWGIVGAVLLLGVWTTGYVASHGWWGWAVGLPIAGAIGGLVALDNVFIAGRWIAHKWRRWRTGPRRATQSPDPTAREPLSYPGILRRPGWARPKGAQGRFRAVGMRLAVLPFLAVALLTAQTVFFKEGGPLALGFVLAECLLLALLVWTVWSRPVPSHAWEAERLKAELFRREMFLLLTGIGPYLGLNEHAAHATRDARLNLLSRGAAPDLLELATMGTSDGRGVETDWQDEVWQRGPMPTDIAVAERMRTYLEYRIRRQRLFFELQTERTGRVDGVHGAVVKSLILAGVAAALAYATLMATGRDLSGSSMLTASVAVLTACVPPLCNSMLAIQNLYGFQRLGRSYADTLRELIVHENTLAALLAEPLAADTGVRFRSLAVRVEATFTVEIRRWWVLVARPEFDAGL